MPLGTSYVQKGLHHIGEKKQKYKYTARRTRKQAHHGRVPVAPRPARLRASPRVKATSAIGERGMSHERSMHGARPPTPDGGSTTAMRARCWVLPVYRIARQQSPSA